MFNWGVFFHYDVDHVNTVRYDAHANGLLYMTYFVSIFLYKG